MRILVTGHTGFKGSWLSLLLSNFGHEVYGISLDPVEGSLYEKANISDCMVSDYRVDIRNRFEVDKIIKLVDPELIFHLAAQPLVRLSYLEPRFTFETNVIGTLNILEAAKSAPSLGAIVIVTTDKVYKNYNRIEGYLEEDQLGGDDPYSASKAMADILVQSWSKSFPGVPTAVVRGGNVIGGGDVSKDRLLVDLLSGFESQIPPEIRYPDAVRPWQHVLDCLNGYLMVAHTLLHDNKQDEWEANSQWNIGPDERSFVTVRELANTACQLWGKPSSWVDVSSEEHFHESSLLALDSTKARTRLGWEDYLPYPESLKWTIDWAKSVSKGNSPAKVTKEQIDAFISKIKRVSTF